MPTSIERFASDAAALNDLRFEPVRFPDRIKHAYKELWDTEREINDRLTKIQTALNALVASVKAQK